MSIARTGITLLVLVAIGAGCASDEEPRGVDPAVVAYADTLTRLTNEYRGVVGQLAPPPEADAADVIGGAAVSMWTYVGAVAALDPPETVAAAHVAYVAAFTASASYMNEATDALKGVPVEEMNAVLAAEFGDTAVGLGADVAAACAELESTVASNGIGVQLGCE